MARGAFPKITKCLRITEKGMFTVPKPAPSPIVIYNTPTYATKSIHVTTFGPKSSRAGTNGDTKKNHNNITTNPWSCKLYIC